MAPNAGDETEKTALPYGDCWTGERLFVCRRTGGFSSAVFEGRYPFAIGMRESVAIESARCRLGWTMTSGLRCGTGRRGILNDCA